MAKKELTAAEKMQALYKLQTIDTQIDKIQTLKGELPMEVEDLEDDLAGLNTRIAKIEVANDVVLLGTTNTPGVV